MTMTMPWRVRLSSPGCTIASLIWKSQGTAQLLEPRSCTNIIHFEHLQGHANTHRTNINKSVFFISGYQSYKSAQLLLVVDHLDAHSERAWEPERLELERSFLLLTLAKQVIVRLCTGRRHSPSDILRTASWRWKQELSQRIRGRATLPISCTSSINGPSATVVAVLWWVLYSKLRLCRPSYKQCLVGRGRKSLGIKWAVCPFVHCFIPTSSFQQLSHSSSYQQTRNLVPRCTESKIISLQTLQLLNLCAQMGSFELALCSQSSHHQTVTLLLFCLVRHFWHVLQHRRRPRSEIMHLPPELQMAIFKTCVAKNNKWCHTHCLIHLSSVCQKWCNIILAMLALWTYVDTSSPDFMATVLPWPQGLLITMVNSAQLYLPLAQHRERVTSLHDRCWCSEDDM